MNDSGAWTARLACLSKRRGQCSTAKLGQTEIKVRRSRCTKYRTSTSTLQLPPYQVSPFKQWLRGSPAGETSRSRYDNEPYWQRRSSCHQTTNWNDQYSTRACQYMVFTKYIMHRCETYSYMSTVNSGCKMGNTASDSITLLLANLAGRQDHCTLTVRQIVIIIF